MAFVKNNNSDINTEKLIMGVDQSFSSTGICITNLSNEILFAASVKTDSKDFLEDRIAFIAKNIIAIAKLYEVKQVVIEGLSYSSIYSSARQLAGLFYVICHELKRNKIKYSIIPPNSLKLKSQGSGKATKPDMKNCIDDEIIKELSKVSGIKDIAKRFEDIVDAYHLSMYYKI